MNPTEKTIEEKLSQLMDGEWHELNPTDCVAALCADEALHGKWSRYHIIRDAIRNEPVSADRDLAASICGAIKDEPAYTNITPFSGSSATSSKTGSSAVDAIEVEQGQQRASAGLAGGAMADQPSSGKPAWVNTGVAGFAVAASVALVTVVGMNLVQNNDQSAVLTQTFTSTDNSTASDLAEPSLPPESIAQTALEDQGNLPVVDFVANTGAFWMSPASSVRVADEKRLNMMLSRHIENSPTAGREGLLPYSRLVGYEETRESSQSR